VAAPSKRVMFFKKRRWLAGWGAGEGRNGPLGGLLAERKPAWGQLDVIDGQGATGERDGGQRQSREDVLLGVGDRLPPYKGKKEARTMNCSRYSELKRKTGVF
jgi:hypothetical protein